MEHREVFLALAGLRRWVTAPFFGERQPHLGGSPQAGEPENRNPIFRETQINRTTVIGAPASKSARLGPIWKSALRFMERKKILATREDSGEWQCSAPSARRP